MFCWPADPLGHFVRCIVVPYFDVIDDARRDILMGFFYERTRRLIDENRGAAPGELRVDITLHDWLKIAVDYYPLVSFHSSCKSIPLKYDRH